jgi:hypothetical protein
MDQFKNAFLGACSVRREDGPTGGRPPAAQTYVLQGQRLQITSRRYAPQHGAPRRNYALEEE